MGLAGALLLFDLGLGSSAGAATAAPTTGAAPRVVHGVTTQQRPTTGALLATDGYANYVQICSGTLIGCRTFLTAAHCVCTGGSSGTCGDPRSADYAVYLQNAGIHAVEAIEVDPSYEFAGGGDVAVLTLAREVEGAEPTRINTSGRVPFGTTVEIAGYGLTHAGAFDSGILRRGSATADDCRNAVNPGTHVCWAFSKPVGDPGTDSNTCYGDSGGPLFADLGDGPSVVGITSGGLSPTCLADDVSWDTDVYVHRGFIESVAGTDLSATSCGSDAPLSDPRTEVARFRFDGVSREAAGCVAAAAKRWTKYVTRAHGAMQSCFDAVNGGASAGPCPDAATAAALEAHSSRITASALASKCPADAMDLVGTIGACRGARSTDELASCLVAAGDGAVAEALRVEYASDNPTRRIADDRARSCQNAVARAGSRFVKAVLKARTRCETMKLDGRVPGCPDSRAALDLARAEDRVKARVAAACSEDDIAMLDAEGSFDRGCTGVTDAEELADCQLAEHYRIAGAMLDVLYVPRQQSDFTIDVPEGTSRLVVATNGIERGSNDLDLYLRHASPASVAEYDAKSENGGMFEGVVVDAPAAGTWHIRLHQYSGTPAIPFQLTATAFAR